MTAEIDRASNAVAAESLSTSTARLESVKAGSGKADPTRQTVGTIADQAVGAVADQAVRTTADTVAGKAAPLDVGSEALRRFGGDVEETADSLLTTIVGTVPPITGVSPSALLPAGAASGAGAFSAPFAAEAPRTQLVPSLDRAVGLGATGQYLGGLEAPSPIDAATAKTAKGGPRGGSVAHAAGPAAGLPQTFEKRPANGVAPDGDAPSPLPESPPTAAVAAPGSSSSFIPIVALLALLALVAPAIFRRLRKMADLSPPLPFVCALERPG